MVTSTSSASRYCDTICPKRPKPMTSTEPVRAVEIVGLALRRAGRGGAARTSVRVANGGPISSVIAAIADSRLPCAALRITEQDAERQQHEGELARAGEHRAGAQRVAALARR